MPDDLAEMLNEIITRLEKVEENQRALEGAIQAFIVVFGIRRLPDKPGENRREADTT